MTDRDHIVVVVLAAYGAASLLANLLDVGRVLGEMLWGTWRKR